MSFSYLHLDQVHQIQATQELDEERIKDPKDTVQKVGAGTQNLGITSLRIIPRIIRQ